MIFLGDHDISLTGSNFGNLTAFRAVSDQRRANLFLHIIKHLTTWLTLQ